MNHLAVTTSRTKYYEAPPGFDLEHYKKAKGGKDGTYVITTRDGIEHTLTATHTLSMKPKLEHVLGDEPKGIKAIKPKEPKEPKPHKHGVVCDVCNAPIEEVPVKKATKKKVAVK